jgi:hypothetical protein
MNWRNFLNMRQSWTKVEGQLKLDWLWSLSWSVFASLVTWMSFELILQSFLTKLVAGQVQWQGKLIGKTNFMTSHLIHPIRFSTSSRFFFGQLPAFHLWSPRLLKVPSTSWPCPPQPCPSPLFPILCFVVARQETIITEIYGQRKGLVIFGVCPCVCVC